MVREITSLWSPGARKWIDRLIRLAYYAAFLGILIMLLWKCRYGFGLFDEAFYLLVPYRVIHGDHLILHEWNLCQFSFFGLIPSMWIYEKIVGTTEGIFLIFRYIYTVCWAAASMFLYLRTKKWNKYGAMFASLFLLSYTPFAIMSFSYNALSILYLLNAAIFLLCAEKHQKIQFAISGVFFAGAVLCYPYLALIYLVCSILVFAAGKRRGRQKPVLPTNHADVRLVWKWFTLGIILLAAVFLAAVMWNVSPQRLAAALMEELKDPDHDNTAIISNTLQYFRNIGGSNAYFYPMLITVLAMTAISLYRRKEIWLGIVCAAVTLYLRRFMEEYAFINYLMLPLTFAGIYVLAVSKDRRIRWIGGMWLIPGVFYTFAIQQLSTQDLYAISSAATVSSAASILMLWMYCDELKRAYRTRAGYKRYGYLIGYFAVLVCMAFQLRYEVPVRYQSVYWTRGLMKYEEHAFLDEGPEKGLISTVEEAERYAECYHDIQSIENRKLLVLTDQFWMYFMNGNELAAYSGWLGTVNDFTLERLQTYYEHCPEKRPEVIFLGKEHEDMLGHFSAETYHSNRLESGNYLIFPVISGSAGQ